MKLVRVERLSTQVFIGAQPDVRRFDPITDYGDAVERGLPCGWLKPHGGLWTSTWETAFTVGWPAWCIAEEFKPIEDGWLLKPARARVLTIRSGADVDAFMRCYGEPLWPGSHRECPAWSRVAEGADAVRLVAPHNPEIRFSPVHMTFYGWDCESTLWFRWCYAGEPEHVDLRELARQARERDAA